MEDQLVLKEGGKRSRSQMKSWEPTADEVPMGHYRGPSGTQKKGAGRTCKTEVLLMSPEVERSLGLQS